MHLQAIGYFPVNINQTKTHFSYIDLISKYSENLNKNKIINLVFFVL